MLYVFFLLIEEAVQLENITLIKLISHEIAFTGEETTWTASHQLGKEVVAGVVRQKMNRARWARWTSGFRQ